jgi:cysteine desulfurase
MRSLYLDYNATTPLAPSVREAMLPFFGEHYGDPSSSHALGRAATEAMEDARGQVASLLGADPEEIVFTSGGTESNNLALLGLALRGGRSAGGHLVISEFEHDSVAQPARFLERLGFDVSLVPVTGQGVVQPAAVRRLLRDETLLVSIMHANHEVGAIQPVKQIADICHEAGVHFHTDAAQTIGKIRTQVDELEVDLLSLTGHKFYGPKGVGALFVRQGVGLEPHLHGTGQESGLRAGTENVAGIVGLGAAASLAAKSLERSQERLAELRDKLLAALRAGIGEELVVFGELASRLPGTLAVSFPAASAYDLLARVPELCAATGSAPHSGTQAVSPTFAAMGVKPATARGFVRLSLGWTTSEDEIERAASLLVGAWEAVRE